MNTIAITLSYLSVFMFGAGAALITAGSYLKKEARKPQNKCLDCEGSPNAVLRTEPEEETNRRLDDTHEAVDFIMHG